MYSLEDRGVQARRKNFGCSHFFQISPKMEYGCCSRRLLPFCVSIFSPSFINKHVLPTRFAKTKKTIFFLEEYIYKSQHFNSNSSLDKEKKKNTTVVNQACSLPCKRVWNRKWLPLKSQH
jgi:hypothetical protein